MSVYMLTMYADGWGWDDAKLPKGNGDGTPSNTVKQDCPKSFDGNHMWRFEKGFHHDQYICTVCQKVRDLKEHEK